MKKNTMEILDYFVWRGDIPLSDDFPFNEVDSVICAIFSYLYLDKIEMSETETIGSIAKKMETLDASEFLYPAYKEYIKLLGMSKRYKDLKVTDYVLKDDVVNEKQFAALTIHINDRECYLSYMGTKADIHAWKEDFNMGFMENVPSQIEGKNYLEFISNKYPNHILRVGGHSKGGNIAIYSAVNVSSEIQDRIIKVYNYEGPGFKKGIGENNSEFLSKIHSYFTQDSIIGRLLNHDEEYSIIKSNAKGGFAQHDPFSWQLNPYDFEYVDEHTKFSNVMDSSISKWLDSIDDEQRKMFIDIVFELIYATQLESFKEIPEDYKKNIQAMLERYKILSKDEKDMIINNALALAFIYFREMVASEKEDAATATKNFGERIKKLFENNNSNFIKAMLAKLNMVERIAGMREEESEPSKEINSDEEIKEV